VNSDGRCSSSPTSMEDESLDTGDLLSEMSIIELGLLLRECLVSRPSFGTEVRLFLHRSEIYADRQILEIGQLEPTQSTLMNQFSLP
jgi:hypothetical protein